MNPNTSCRSLFRHRRNCFQWFKDTNLKANHNCFQKLDTALVEVKSVSVIL